MEGNIEESIDEKAEKETINYDDFISLRKFKNNAEFLYDIFGSGITKKISIYVQSVNCDKYTILEAKHIQIIQSNHPVKVKLYIGPSSEFNLKLRKAMKPGFEPYLTVNFLDLWIKKTDAEKVITTSPLSLAIPSPTEKNTMLKLILGMAMAAYQYNPLSTRNSATGNNKGSIKHELEKIGLKIDEDTIRKYLEEAKEIYKKELKKDSRKIFLD